MRHLHRWRSRSPHRINHYEDVVIRVVGADAHLRAVTDRRPFGNSHAVLSFVEQRRMLNTLRLLRDEEVTTVTQL